MKHCLCPVIALLLLVGCSQMHLPEPHYVAEQDRVSTVLPPDTAGYVQDALEMVQIVPTQDVSERIAELRAQFLSQIAASSQPAQATPPRNPISPDGTKMVMLGPGMVATIYTVASIDENGTARRGTELHRLTLTGQARSADFSPDGTKIATGCMRGFLRLWDAETGRELKGWTAHPQIVCCDAGIMALAFSPDGTKIATGGRAGTAKIWDAESGNELQALTGLATTLNSITFSPDGQQVITRSGDGNTRTWGVER